MTIRLVAMSTVANHRSPADSQLGPHHSLFPDWLLLSTNQRLAKILGTHRGHGGSFFSLRLPISTRVLMRKEELEVRCVADVLGVLP